MQVLLVLLPAALGMATIGLIGFFWALNNGQYDDLQGAAERILYDEEETEEENDD